MNTTTRSPVQRGWRSKGRAGLQAMSMGAYSNPSEMGASLKAQ